MMTAPGAQTKKPAATFRIAAGSFEGVVLTALGLQHIFFAPRQSALLKKEEAVGKGEIEK
jgi:hypothetical protein